MAPDTPQRSGHPGGPGAPRGPGFSDSLRSAVPTVEEIDAIVARDDSPVLRNLLITDAYYRLSQAVAGMVGAENANWCTFATWASKTAGRFIRGELIVSPAAGPVRSITVWPAWTMDRPLTREALMSLEHAHDPGASVLEACITSVVRDTARLVAAGNLAVFEEIAPLFAKVVARFGTAGRDPRALKEFLDGATAPWARQGGGQPLLRHALLHLVEARFERDPQRKAERLLLANAQVGLHEQTRLQPYIRRSIESTVAEAVWRVHEAHRAAPGGWAGRLLAVLDRVLRPFVVRVIERWWEGFITRQMMELRLPEGVIHLGRDLPPLGGALFPPDLEQLLARELHGLLVRFRDDAARGAADWADLHDRMRFIFALFRSRQHDAALLEQPPFTEAQRAALARGEIPGGEL